MTGVELATQQLWLKLVGVGVGSAAYLVWALLGIAPVMEQVLRPADAAEMPQWPGGCYLPTNRTLQDTPTSLQAMFRHNGDRHYRFPPLSSSRRAS